MKLNKSIYLILLLSLVTFSSAEESKSCLETADTQFAMNQCAGIGYKEADDELNRVYKEIQSLYKDDPLFLEKLKAAQLAWITLRDADMELYFPMENKRRNYGSVYSMCAAGIKTKLTLARVEFLKQWLNGSEEGEVCSGSVRATQISPDLTEWDVTKLVEKNYPYITYSIQYDITNEYHPVRDVWVFHYQSKEPCVDCDFDLEINDDKDDPSVKKIF